MKDISNTIRDSKVLPCTPLHVFAATTRDIRISEATPATIPANWFIGRKC